MKIEVSNLSDRELKELELYDALDERLGDDDDDVLTEEEREDWEARFAAEGFQSPFFDADSEPKSPESLPDGIRDIIDVDIPSVGIVHGQDDEADLLAAQHRKYLSGDGFVCIVYEKYPGTAFRVEMAEVTKFLGLDAWSDAAKSAGVGTKVSIDPTEEGETLRRSIARFAIDTMKSAV